MGVLKFQSFVNVRPHKLLHPRQTRWLSLHIVVSRLLEQWKALKLYFTRAVLSERLITCENIIHRLNNSFTKMSSQFLDFVLRMFNSFNLQMQSESSQVHKLHKSITQSFRTLLECYLKDDYLRKTPISSVEFQDLHNLKELSSIYLGAKVGMSLSQDRQTLPSQDMQVFCQSCQMLFIVAETQICKRFPFADVTFQNLEVLDPLIVRRESVDLLAPLMTSFPSLVPQRTVQDIDTEWRLLRNSEVLTCDLGTT